MEGGALDQTSVPACMALLDEDVKQVCTQAVMLRMSVNWQRIKAIWRLFRAHRPFGGYG